MTALLADSIPTMPAMPRRNAAGAVASPAVGETPWAVVVPLRAEGRAAVSAPAAVGVAQPRYEWTNRGLAVMLALVALVVTVMTATLVTAFLAVSNEPIGPRGATAAVAVLAPR